jgi:hypothetical protein
MSLRENPKRKELQMITWIRSAVIVPGKMGDAVAFVKKSTKLIQEKHHLTISASRPLAGNPTRLFWSSQHPDLQEYVNAHQKINTDPEFQQMLLESSNCFLGGTTHDEILQSL